MVCLYTVKTPGFRKVVETLDSRHELPSRSYFSRTALPDLYTQVKDRVEAELGSIIYLSQPSFAF